MSGYDGGGVLTSIVAAQAMSDSAVNSAPLRGDPWWELPLLLAAITVTIAANLWMIRLERRGR